MWVHAHCGTQPSPGSTHSSSRLALEGCDFCHNVQALLEEYEVCRKYDETVCCLRSLDAPHYHHELTKRALLAAFEKPDQAPALLELLQRLTDTGVVSQVTAHLPSS